MGWLVIGLFLLHLRLSLVRSELNHICTTTNNQIGRCTQARDCNSQSESPSVLHNSCGQITGNPPNALVCCPVIQNVESCGVSKLGPRVVGGEVTDFGLYPWAGVIVYKVSKRKFSVNCGCALVHHRWVLTAAHCISGIPRSRTIHRVRFNEWDTTKTANCTIENNVHICRQEYEIEQQFTHPSYQINSVNKRHDIGLLKTKTDVIINDFVIPICLPFSSIIKQLPIDQEEFIVTGWGKTDQETSGIQRHIILTGQNNSVCDQAFKSDGIKISEDQLCIGGANGQDSCRGDSGGPLMRTNGLVHYLVGVVSFGAYKCGTQHHPGVYTKVVNHLDWVEEIMIES